MTFSTALTVAGSDSGGGAGIQADLKTFTVLGVYGTSAVTAVTAQNTLGVQAVEVLTPSLVRAQLDSVLADFDIQAVKTGMLGTAAVVREVAQALGQRRLPLVVDPVMIAKGGHPLLDPEAKSAVIQHLLPLALVVTPNLHEAAAITGMDIASLEDMERAARRLGDMGAQWVVVKGGHLEGDACDLVWDRRAATVLRSRRIATRHTHGTGCTFAAAITAFLAHWEPVDWAIRRAKTFITRAIEYAPGLGHGHGPTNPMYWLGRDCPQIWE
jgi:hydroxymethylpyrimidine/phosphomethylpyrimidine kinase